MVRVAAGHLNGKPLAMAMICMCDAAIFMVMEALVGSFSFVPMDFQMKIPVYIYLFLRKK